MARQTKRDCAGARAPLPLLRAPPEGALAAIPDMLPNEASQRKRILEAIRRTADAAGVAEGERAARLAKLEKLFGAETPALTAKKAPRKGARRVKS